MQALSTRCATQARARRVQPSRAVRAWLWLLAALLAAWTGPLAAAPSPHCGPFNITVDNGGNYTIDASACDGPDDLGIGGEDAPGVDPPEHGRMSIDVLGQQVTYIHGGNTATSDSFVFGDGLGNTVQVNVTIRPATSAIRITPDIIALRLGQALSQSLSAEGGVGPYAFAVAGDLPDGVVFSGGRFSGTPRQRGEFPITVTATDSSTPTPLTANKTYVLEAEFTAPQIAPATLPEMAVGIDYSQQLQSSGGYAPYRYAVEAAPGPLPPGLSLSSTGLLSGRPSLAGNYRFRVSSTDDSTSTDGSGNVGTREYIVTVAAAPTIVLGPDTLPGGSFGAAYSVDFDASGGTAPYRFEVDVSTPLPPGLGLSGARLSGTPSVAGEFNLRFRAIDANGFSGNRDYRLSIAPPSIAIMPDALPSARAGSDFLVVFEASGGTASYVFSMPAAQLPPGLGLSSLGVLSGTPTSSGDFTFTVTARDSSSGGGFTGERTYTLSIAPPDLQLPPTSLANATRGTPYSAILNPASGGVAPYRYELDAGSALPAGLSLSSDGAISGTPTAPGATGFTVRATDSSGGGPHSVTQDYRLSVDEIAPVATPGSIATDYGVAGRLRPTINGGAATALEIATAPAHGRAEVAGEELVYTPNAGYAGNDSFSYVARNAVGASAPALISVAVRDPNIAIADSGPGSVRAGSAYSRTFTWSGGQAPYRDFNASGLPAGLNVTATSTDSLTISGTPTRVGAANFTVSARDSSTGTGPFTVGQLFSLEVTAPVLTMTPAAGNLSWNYGAPNQTRFQAAGGSGDYVYTVVSGSPPVGVSLSAAGVLSGTPTVPGSYPLTVRATDRVIGDGGGASYSVEQAYVVQVGAPDIQIQPAELPAGSAGTFYSVALSASGGAGPYTFSFDSGDLPIGMSMSSAGLISGVPRSHGTFVLTVRATDRNGLSSQRVTELRIAPAVLAITPASLPDGVVGVAYSVGLSASGGVAPYTYAAVSGALPPGVALSSAGRISGTPVLAGAYSLRLRATDDAGYTATIDYPIQIADAVPVAVDDSATTQANQAATVAVAANDTGIVTSIALASLPSHGSAEVRGLEVVYTPAADFFGSDGFTYTASGPGGTSAPASVSLSVAALPVPQGQPQRVTTLATQPVLIDAAAGANGGPFTGVSLLEPPASGTAVVQGLTQILYTPAADGSGEVALRYTLNNAFGASAPIVSVVVVNAVPVAVSQRVRTVAGQAVTVDLTAGARGGPFTAADLVALTPASSGEASVLAEAGVYRLRYTPAIGFAGIATARFTLSNAHATSAVATVEIDVAPRSDPSKDAEVLGLLNAQAAATRRFANAQIGNFQQRMEGLHGGDGQGGRYDHGLSFSIDARCRDQAWPTPGSDCRQPRLGDEAAAVQPQPEVPGSGARWGLWTGGAINSGDRDARGGSAGLDFETSGVSAGGDYRLREDLAIGAGLGYGRDRTDVGERGTRSRADSYTVAAYASYHPGQRFYLDGLLGYQWLSFHAQRYVTDTGGRVRGERDGSQWFASVSAGLDYRDQRWLFSPYARLDVARARLDGYTERGDALYALHYRDQDVDTTTTSLGLRVEYRHDTRWGSLSPQLRLEYQHDLHEDSDAQLRYADMLAGPFYRARLQGLDRNRLVFGLGAVLQVERDWMLRLEYRGLFGSGQDRDNAFQVNLEKSF